MKPWKRCVRTAGITLGAGIAFLILYVMIFESKFIYFPTKYPDGYWKWPEKAPFPVEEVTVTADDGVKTVGWYAKKPGAMWTILWFHGNAGNLTNRHDQLEAMVQGLGVDMLIMDYRGYGKSEGSPSENGINRDVDAAWRFLVEERGIAPARLVIFGDSLGGGPATQLASTRPAAGLVLQSAFTSLGDMSKHVMPIFPARWFMRNKFDNLSKIGAIGMQKLLIHSRRDRIIPFAMGERLFEAAAEPKRAAWWEKLDHNDLFYGNRAEYLWTWREWLETLPR